MSSSPPKPSPAVATPPVQGTPSVPPPIPAKQDQPSRLALELKADAKAEGVRDDEVLVHVLGDGETLTATRRPGFFAGLFRSPRRFIVRSSLLDRGPNVVDWLMESRIEPLQGPEDGRIRIRVRVWVPPEGCEAYALFCARHPRLHETLEHLIEESFMSELPDVAKSEPLPVVETANSNGSVPRSNPRNYAAQLERRLALKLQESFNVENTGLEFRCAISLPDIIPILTLSHPIELQLKGPGHVQLRLNTTVQLRLRGHDGVIRFLKSGVTDLPRWCRESVEHVIKHNHFGTDMLDFLSNLDRRLLPQFESHLRNEAESIGYDVSSIISEPIDRDGKVPGFYSAMKSLPIADNADFETSDPVVKVRLGYELGCRLESLNGPRISSAIHRGENLQQVINAELKQAIKRVVERQTPQEAYDVFEDGRVPEKELKELVKDAIIETLALYNAIPDRVSGPNSSEVPNVTVRREENRIGVLWRLLNNLQVRVNSRYESASNVLVRARIQVDLRVDSIGKDKSRQSWTTGFLQFLRFMPAEETGGRVDANTVTAVTEFIAEKIRSFLDGRFSTLPSREFLAYMIAVRRDYFGEIELPHSPGGDVDFFARLNDKLQKWIEDFSIREFGLGVRVTQFLIEPNETVLEYIRQLDGSKLLHLHGRSTRLQARIAEIDSRLAAEKDILTAGELGELEVERGVLTRQLLDLGVAEALSSGPNPRRPGGTAGAAVGGEGQVLAPADAT